MLPGQSLSLLVGEHQQQQRRYDVELVEAPLTNYLEVVQRHEARRSALVDEARQLAWALAQARADVEVMDAALATATL